MFLTPNTCYSRSLFFFFLTERLKEGEVKAEGGRERRRDKGERERQRERRQGGNTGLGHKPSVANGLLE